MLNNTTSILIPVSQSRTLFLAFLKKPGKGNHVDRSGYSADDRADFELRTEYENFSIEHTLKHRPNATPGNHMIDYIDSKNYNPKFAQMLKKSRKNETLSDGMMPMLTWSGFVRMFTMESLYQPSIGWAHFNRIAQHYGIWRQWGDLPRTMLPDGPPADLAAEIQVIAQQTTERAAARQAAMLQNSTARASSIINANAARLALQAQGENNALRLLDPPGTRYIYRY
jgi:hypothetical protein